MNEIPTLEERIAAAFRRWATGTEPAEKVFPELLDEVAGRKAPPPDDAREQSVPTR